MYRMNNVYDEQSFRVCIANMLRACIMKINVKHIKILETRLSNAEIYISYRFAQFNECIISEAIPIHLMSYKVHF